MATKCARPKLPPGVGLDAATWYSARMLEGLGLDRAAVETARRAGRLRCADTGGLPLFKGGDVLDWLGVSEEPPVAAKWPAYHASYGDAGVIDAADSLAELTRDLRETFSRCEGDIVLYRQATPDDAPRVVGILRPSLHEGLLWLAIP